VRQVPVNNRHQAHKAQIHYTRGNASPYVNSRNSLILRSVYPLSRSQSSIKRLLSRRADTMSEFAPKQILCPVDLSASSDSVLIRARSLAVLFGARLEVLYAN
jgi:hypothetical protein